MMIKSLLALLNIILITKNFDRRGSSVKTASTPFRNTGLPCMASLPFSHRWQSLARLTEFAPGAGPQQQRPAGNEPLKPARFAGALTPELHGQTVRTPHGTVAHSHVSFQGVWRKQASRVYNSHCV